MGVRAAFVLPERRLAPLGVGRPTQGPVPWPVVRTRRALLLLGLCEAARADPGVWVGHDELLELYRDRFDGDADPCRVRHHLLVLDDQLRTAGVVLERRRERLRVQLSHRVAFIGGRVCA